MLGDYGFKKYLMGHMLKEQKVGLASAIALGAAYFGFRNIPVEPIVYKTNLPDVTYEISGIIPVDGGPALDRLIPDKLTQIALNISKPGNYYVRVEGRASYRPNPFQEISWPVSEEVNFFNVKTSSIPRTFVAGDVTKVVVIPISKEPLSGEIIKL